MNTHRFDNELEQASGVYLMSLAVALVGLPLPIVNLLATVGFAFAVRKSRSSFVRWHCLQALVSQVPLFVTNTILFWWTIALFLGKTPLTSFYFAYLFTIILFNVLELFATVYAAIRVRQGKHIKFFACGALIDLVYKPIDS